MSRGLFFAAAATLTVLSSLTAVSAMPASIGSSLQPGDAAITKVQYYTGYDYGSPLDLPAAVIGGTLGLVTGAFSATTMAGIAAVRLVSLPTPTVWPPAQPITCLSIRLPGPTRPMKASRFFAPSFVKSLVS